MRAAFFEGNQTFRVGPCVPVPAGPGQVQIRVQFCGICGTDLHLFHGAMANRLTLPHVMGHEMSGVIAAVGAGVTQYQPGDRVTVRPLDPCGQCPACQAGHSHICHSLKFIGIDTPGALQGLWTVPAHTLHRLPESLSLRQGAMVEPIAVACHDVRMGEVRAAENCVVIGGGPIGVLIALVAQARGAHVLMAEVNPFRVQLARQLGIDAVNPKETDLVALVNQHTGGAGADVVFEVSGSRAGSEMMTRLPRTRGRIVVVAIYAEPAQVDLFRFFWRELKLSGARVYEPEDFEMAIQLAASGSLPLEKLITNVVPLDRLEAGMRQMEGGGEVMKILVSCGD
ncbi:MAG TPA: alcohol dehydrogenase catalytic domain-containing protein [Candidatus Acidoferrales bacterium]|jgi:(R,R)-butanediol dehydrogenase/meso-butanediol dehydrogenase/diacetyl reductase|nr:alcohol dehydrogenase catalytic domain-containing protein [Candidatus Acidoferrales bacterium]